MQYPYSSYSQLLVNMETMRLSTWILYLLILTVLEIFHHIIFYEMKVQRYLKGV